MIIYQDCPAFPGQSFLSYKIRIVAMKLQQKELFLPSLENENS